jgi:hypothetical protein
LALSHFSLIPGADIPAPPFPLNKYGDLVAFTSFRSVHISRNVPIAKLTVNLLITIVYANKFEMTIQNIEFNIQNCMGLIHYFKSGI